MRHVKAKVSHQQISARDRVTQSRAQHITCSALSNGCAIVFIRGIDLHSSGNDSARNDLRRKHGGASQLLKTSVKTVAAAALRVAAETWHGMA
jgi:hypothetical protein